VSFGCAQAGGHRPKNLLAWRLQSTILRRARLLAGVQAWWSAPEWRTTSIPRAFALFYRCAVRDDDDDDHDDRDDHDDHDDQTTTTMITVAAALGGRPTGGLLSGS
jgi:hypothetical protein